MTCIIGYVHKGKVYIGADSLGSTGDSISNLGVPKVFIIRDYIFGYVASYRMGQIIRYHFDPPECNHWDLERFMVVEFIESLKKCLIKYGYGSEDEGGNFLVGYRGRLWEVESDFQINWSYKNYIATGSGVRIATGVMYALDSVDPNCIQYSPEYRIEMALKGAEEFVASVRGPFDILSI